MFSLIRGRTGGVLPLARQPLRVIPQIQSRGFQNVHIQKVRMWPRRPTAKTFAAFAITAYGCHLFYNHVVIGPLVKAYDDFEKNMDESTRKQLEKAIDEDDSTWFIPFPGTTKMIKPKPYKGTDPEWVEYIKFSKDRELATKVRSDLAEKIKSLCSKDQFLTRHVGKQMKIRRYWLDIDFPIMPPPTYERSGIEITDEYVSWTTMPVDSLTVNRLRQILWPKVFIHSSYAFIKVLFSQNLQRAGTLVGMETKPQPTYDSLVALQKARTANGNSSGMPSVPTTQTPNPSAGRKQPDMINARTPETKTSTSTTPSPNNKNALDPQANERSPPVSPIGSDSLLKPSFELFQQHMSSARAAFKAKWASSWRPTPADPPRGSIVVSGMVEIEATKAWLVVDVKANWDPKTKDYDMRSTRFALRRVQPKNRRFPRVRRDIGGGKGGC